VRAVPGQKGPIPERPIPKGPLYKGTRKTHVWIPERPTYFISYQKGPQIGILYGKNIYGPYDIDKTI